MEFAQGARSWLLYGTLVSSNGKGNYEVHVSGGFNERRPLNKIFIACVHILYSSYMYIGRARILHATGL